MKREFPKNESQSAYPGKPAKQVEEHLLQFYETIDQVKPGGAPSTRKYSRDYSKDQPVQEDMFGSMPMRF